MGLRTVKLRRLLVATALCGSMAIAATGIGAGIADAAPLGPATASLYPVPSLLTDR